MKLSKTLECGLRVRLQVLLYPKATRLGRRLAAKAHWIIRTGKKFFKNEDKTKYCLANYSSYLIYIPLHNIP